MNLLPTHEENIMQQSARLSGSHELGGGQFSPVQVPVPDGQLQAGNSYRYLAVIDANTVTFPSVGVTDWVDVDETGNPLYPH